MNTLIKNGILIIFLLALISCTTPAPVVREPVPVVTQPPIVNEPPVVKIEGPIGFIGCSNTGQTVDGYHAVGGTRIWAVDRSLAVNKGGYPPFGGGTPNKWAENLSTDNNAYWKTFDAYLAMHPDTKIVWWQFCIRQTDALSYENVEMVLQELREHIPGVTVYVSPLPPFTDHVCGITGKNGFERMRGLAKQLIDTEEDVLAGPLLPGLVRAETVKDGCHMTDAGERKVGAGLKEFFDK